jgi:hypothetical protein
MAKQAQPKELVVSTSYTMQDDHRRQTHRNLNSFTLNVGNFTIYITPDELSIREGARAYPPGASYAIVSGTYPPPPRQQIVFDL